LDIFISNVESRAQSLFFALGAPVLPGVNFWAHGQNFRRMAKILGAQVKILGAQLECLEY